MFTPLHSSTNQELFKKHICKHSSRYETCDGAARLSYHLKPKYPLPFSVSYVWLIKQQYESRTVRKAPSLMRWVLLKSCAIHLIIQHTNHIVDTLLLLAYTDSVFPESTALNSSRILRPSRLVNIKFCTKSPDTSSDAKPVSGSLESQKAIIREDISQLSHNYIGAGQIWVCKTAICNIIKTIINFWSKTCIG